MKITTNKLLCLLTALLVASFSALAQTDPADPGMLPAEQKFGSVSYITGGVPDEQASAFKAVRSDYPLAIEVYQKAGAKSEYTADAEITVTDRKGLDVLVAKADGPFLYADLPAGTYDITAVLEGKTVQKKGVHVGKSGSTRAVLVFPQGTD